MIYTKIEQGGIHSDIMRSNFLITKKIFLLMYILLSCVLFAQEQVIYVVERDTMAMIGKAPILLSCILASIFQPPMLVMVHYLTIHMSTI